MKSIIFIEFFLVISKIAQCYEILEDYCAKTYTYINDVKNIKYIIQS